MSNQKIAQEVFEQVGGEKNIANATHCATRLRLNLKDNQQVDLKALDQIDGVIKAQLSNGQLQVVLGGKVNDVYEEFMNLLGGSTNERSSTVEKKNLALVY
ncbi:PTS transporter subunit EIIB [Enterococcus termitis]